VCIFRAAVAYFRKIVHNGGVSFVGYAQRSPCGPGQQNCIFIHPWEENTWNWLI